MLRKKEENKKQKKKRWDKQYSPCFCVNVGGRRKGVGTLRGGVGVEKKVCYRRVNESNLHCCTGHHPVHQASLSYFGVAIFMAMCSGLLDVFCKVLWLDASERRCMKAICQCSRIQLKKKK